MDDTQNVGGRDRLARALLAVVLTVAALRWFRSGKRLRGLLASAGALAFGFNATPKYCGVNDTLNVDTTSGQATPEQTVDLESDSGGPVETKAETEDNPASKKSRPSGALTCAACGDPIRVGERRGPNDQDEIVHSGCA